MKLQRFFLLQDVLHLLEEDVPIPAILKLGRHLLQREAPRPHLLNGVPAVRQRLLRRKRLQLAMHQTVIVPPERRGHLHVRLESQSAVRLCLHGDACRHAADKLFPAVRQ